MSHRPTRTRFAPSPTGYLHIGAVRTALFAWLLARQDTHEGKFILRLEDTDKAREVEGAAHQIMESLQWLGLNWDEGPGLGEHGPYLQSERLDVYKRYAQQLLVSGKAYADPYTPQQLDEFRQAAKAAKVPFHFNDHRPSNPPEWDGTQPLRLKVDFEISPEWHDAIRGPQLGSSENIDDFIIIKADGYPTYNFAHIIDDYEMKISHILRGEEFISSMPKFMALYQALDITPPVFAHLPQVLGADKKKLSKRHGALNVLEYRSLGYLPEALINFLVLLGWNDGSEQEFYTIDELIAKFSLPRVQSSPAIFDEQRLSWVNGHYIRQLSIDELFDRSAAFWPESAKNYPEDYQKKVLALIQERLKYLAEIPELAEFFFTDPTVFPEQLDKDFTQKYLPQVIATIEASDFTIVDLETKLRELVETLGVKTGELFKAIRISLTGQTAAPGLFATMELLGKENCLKRLKSVLS